MKEVLGVPVKVGDWLVTWVPGAGVTIKQIVDFDEGRPVVIGQKNKRVVCLSNFMKVTDQLKINKKQHPELFI